MDHDEATADDWWAHLPPQRRVQIYRWIERPIEAGMTPGQLALIEKTNERNTNAQESA